MTEYIVSMKSGRSFVAMIKDFDLFTKDLTDAINPQSVNNFIIMGGMVINISDISAIYPRSSEHA